MDCQGLYDPNESCEMVDAIVSLHALELSTVHIFNVKGDISAVDLQQLAVRIRV